MHLTRAPGSRRLFVCVVIIVMCVIISIINCCSLVIIIIIIMITVLCTVCLLFAPESKRCSSRGVRVLLVLDASETKHLGCTE